MDDRAHGSVRAELRERGRHVVTELDQPKVSVIVPVKDRRELLGALLRALDAQTYDDFEVIVIDDGSRDGSAEEAQRLVKGRPVVLLDGRGRGAVAARRLGVEQSRGSVLAFTDSDCLPVPTWLAHGVDAIDAGADLVNGRTQPARPMLPLERSLGSGTEGLFPTCNLFVRRNAYDKAGGFDETLERRWGFRRDARSRGGGFGEDTLLGWRIARVGTHRYVPGALVHHHVFDPDYAEMVSRTAQVAAFPAMVREVPELRRTLCRHRVQLGDRSRLPLYVATAALAARRPGLTASAVAAWTLLRLHELRRFPITTRRQLELLPVEMAVDVITAAALIVGSARARSLVL